MSGHDEEDNDSDDSDNDDSDNELNTISGAGEEDDDNHSFRLVLHGYSLIII